MKYECFFDCGTGELRHQEGRICRYNSASEVVREALRLLEEHEQSRAAQLAHFNEELGRRLASLDRGEHVNPRKARARLQHKSEDRLKKRA